MPIQCTCVRCGTPFTRPPSHLQRYCTRRCAYDARTKPPRVCAQCGGPYPGAVRAQRFCSLACRDASMRTSLEAKLWNGVAREDGCWLRSRNLDADGYSRVITKSGSIRAHRLAYELTYGPIPDGSLIRHLCPGGGNPACVRPDHLAPGTPADNVADRVAAGNSATGARNGVYTKPERRRRGETHGCAKLTGDQVVEIRRRHASGSATITDLSQEFGVSVSTASAIVRRVTWGHIS